MVSPPWFQVFMSRPSMTRRVGAQRKLRGNTGSRYVIATKRAPDLCMYVCRKCKAPCSGAGICLRWGMRSGSAPLISSTPPTRLQVELGSRVVVHGVDVQGAAQYDEWLTSFTVRRLSLTHTHTPLSRAHARSL